MSRTNAVLHKVTIPTESAITVALKRHDYLDAYEVQLRQPELQVCDAYVAIFCDPPAWVQSLMNLRGRMAVRLGLTHPFDVPAMLPDDRSRFEPGLRVGSFTVQAISPNELIVGDDDKHLNFRISTLKTVREGKSYITVSTVVEIHNTLGRAYMFIVKPFHRFLAPYMLRRAASSGSL